MRTMSQRWATDNGFGSDKRKRRRQHRRCALYLLRNGGGHTFEAVAWWHRQQARYLGR